MRNALRFFRRTGREDDIYRVVERQLLELDSLGACGLMLVDDDITYEAHIAFLYSTRTYGLSIADFALE